MNTYQAVVKSYDKKRKPKTTKLWRCERKYILETTGSAPAVFWETIWEMQNKKKKTKKNESHVLPPECLMDTV